MSNFTVQGFYANGHVMPLPGAEFKTFEQARSYRDHLREQHPDASIWVSAPEGVEIPVGAAWSTQRH